MPTHDYWSDSENYLVSEKEVESDQEKTKKDKNYREVVLKTLTNSQSNADFLDEAAKHKIIDDWFNNLVPCYGLSQDPEGNYLMVMKYLPERDLRHYLKKNQQELKEKLIKKEEFDWKFNIE
jgi:serine/threonine protein kinase